MGYYIIHRIVKDEISCKNWLGDKMQSRKCNKCGKEECNCERYRCIKCGNKLSEMQ